MSVLSFKLKRLEDRRARVRRFGLWKRWKAGETQTAIAAELGLTPGRISAMVRQFDDEFQAVTNGVYGWPCLPDIVDYETDRAYGKWFPCEPSA